MGHRLLLDHLKEYRGSIRTALHVGANKANERYQWETLRANRVIWVEADPAAIPDIEWNLRGLPDQEVHQALLGDKDDESSEFHVMSVRGANSMLPVLADGCLGYIPEENVTAMTMTRADTLLRKLDIAPGDLNALVVDVQGTELQVLQGLGDYIHRVKYVVAEYFEKPVYEGQTTVQDLVLFMVNMGCRLWAHRGVTGPARDAVGDFLFVRGAPARRPQ